MALSKIQHQYNINTSLKHILLNNRLFKKLLRMYGLIENQTINYTD